MKYLRMLFLLFCLNMTFTSMGLAEGKHDHHDEHERTEMHVDDESREMINFKSEKVTRRSLGDRLKVYGQVARDTENYSHITFEEEAVIEAILVQLGDVVDEGDELISIKKSDSQTDIVKSKSHGTVISIYIKPGDKIDRLKSLMSLINLDLLRTTIDVYEKDLRFIKVGQKVEFQSIAYPDRVFHGNIVFISPEIDEKSKAIKVRVNVENQDHLLKLGMSLAGEVIYHSDKEVLVVPVEAVQKRQHEKIVFVPAKNDEIQIREVELGHQFDRFVEVKSGLEEGETVVTHGSFYLQSELAKEAFGDGHAH